MKIKQNPLFHGAASELIIPFTREGEIDYRLADEEIDYVLSAGATGLYINGYQTEYLMLSPKEKGEVTRHIAERVNGRVPVIGNILVDSPYEGKELARMYREIGLDAIMLFTPFTFPFAPESMKLLFLSIVEAGGLPAYICNAPNGNKLSPKRVIDLFDSSELIIGCKDATKSILELQQLIDLSGERELEIMSGSDAETYVTMMLGGLGIFSLLCTVFPSLITGLAGACEKGDWDRGQDLQARVNRIREGIKIGPFMAAYKYVARKIGHPMGYMRAPFVEINEADAEKIDAVMKAEGVY